MSHPAHSDRPPRLPHLENGDHLDRAEFHRRYSGRHDIKKAELVEGIVYIRCGVTADHSSAHTAIVTWLALYQMATAGVKSNMNVTTLLDDANEFQPDVHMRILESHGGQARVSPDGFVVGGPEFVGEIAYHAASIDLHAKARVYLRRGVLEYLVWRVDDGMIDWFIRRGERFELLTPGDDGIIRSETFPGLWLDVAAMLDGQQGLRVMETVRRGAASPEQELFVARLAVTARAAGINGGTDS